MQLKDAIQEFILECKVRRLVPWTIDNRGKADNDILLDKEKRL